MKNEKIRIWLSQIERTANLKRKLAGRALRKENIKTLICEQAYRLFERRGRSHGSDMDDWFEAEKTVMKKSAR